MGRDLSEWLGRVGGIEWKAAENLVGVLARDASAKGGVEPRLEPRLEPRSEHDRMRKGLAEGRMEYSPVRRIPSKAGRTNDYGLKSNRWYEVRKGGGWVGKYTKVGKAWETDEAKREGRVAKKTRGEVEAVMKRKAWPAARKAGEAGAGEGRGRQLGPVMRSGLRKLGQGKHKNGRPVEKRVRRSRGETREERGKSVREYGEPRWERERSRAEERKRGEDRRETREARKRYMGRPRRGAVVGVKERHGKRLEREDMERVGGESLKAKVWAECGVERTGRAKAQLGEQPDSEGTGRKARREVQKREEVGERRDWGRKSLSRDGLGVGKRSGLMRLGVWRTKEKLVVERERGVEPKGRRREEVEGREGREWKEYGEQGRGEAGERAGRKGREREMRGEE